MSDDRFWTAVIVLAACFAFVGLAVLLWMLGGIGKVFAIVFVTFSVMGCVQAIGVGRGRDKTGDDRRR